jgi:hypothetical protein
MAQVEVSNNVRILATRWQIEISFIIFADYNVFGKVFTEAVWVEQARG